MWNLFSLFKILLLGVHRFQNLPYNNSNNSPSSITPPTIKYNGKREGKKNNQLIHSVCYWGGRGRGTKKKPISCLLPILHGK